MKTSTTLQKNKKSARLQNVLLGAASAAFWLLLWALASRAVGQEILLPSPAVVFRRLCALAVTGRFWLTAFRSLGNVLLGFLWGTAAGILAAVLCCLSRVLAALLRPVTAAIKATPVASFIILALVWIARPAVPAFIAGLIVFPVICGNVAEGIRHIDRELLEKARVHRVGRLRTLLYVALPGVFPYLFSAMSTSLGLAWKAGIAAEVLSTPKNTIGTQLYNAKIYIETADLFAWTLVVILLSLGVETLLVRLQRRFSWRLPLRPGKCRTPVLSGIPSLPPVTKHFGEKAVLKNMALPLRPGTVTALLGPSGSGKTTLLRILAGLEADDSGHRGETPCTFLFQEDRLLPGRTPRENILFLRPDADTDSLLALVELSDCADQPVETLSGGMKRRVAIAAALACPAPLVLLDEPFRGLDEATRDRIAPRVFARLQSAAVVLVTHDPREARDYAQVTASMDGVQN